MPVLTFMGGPDENSKYKLTLTRGDGPATLALEPADFAQGNTIYLQSWVNNDFTLTPNNWDTTNNTYTIQLATITATSTQVISLRPNATEAQYDAFCGAKIVDYSQSAGSLTIKALGTIPSISIPIRLVLYPF